MPSFFREFTSTWIIKDLDHCNISPLFTAKNIDGTQWFIKFSFDTILKNEYIFFSLTRNAWDNVTIDIEIELYDSKNEVLCIAEKIKEAEFNERMRSHDFPRIFLSDELKEKIVKVSTLIVQCRMGMSLESETLENPLNRSCTIRTIRYLEESSYLRKVEYSEDLDWSYILVLTIRGSQYEVCINAHHDGLVFEFSPFDYLKNYIEIYKCEIILLDQEGKVIMSKNKVLLFNKTSNFNFHPFCKRSFLLQKEIRVLFLKFNLTLNDNLVFDSAIDEAIQHNHLPSSPNVFKSIPANNSLREDFRKTFQSKKYADVSFRVDSEVISALKIFLASRSTVFSAMFDQEMVENQTGVINISDMDVQTLKLFLEFFYIGDVEELDWERALDLLLAADKYQVPSLKEKCSMFLKRHTSPDNVCDVVSVADKMGEKILKEAAIGYIKDNVATVFASPKWSEFVDRNVKLCSEIIKNLSEDLKVKHKEI